MSLGRVLLVALVLVIAVVYVLGVGLGVRDQGDQSFANDWISSIGDFVVQPAHPGDLSPSPPSCRQGQDLVVTVALPCTYHLQSGFDGRRVRIRFADGSAPGVTAAITLTQPGIPAGTRQLTPGADPVSLIYQKQGSSLAVGCLGLPTTAVCRLRLVDG